MKTTFHSVIILTIIGLIYSCSSGNSNLNKIRLSGFCDSLNSKQCYVKQTGNQVTFLIEQPEALRSNAPVFVASPIATKLYSILKDNNLDSLIIVISDEPAAFSESFSYGMKQLKFYSELAQPLVKKFFTSVEKLDTSNVVNCFDLNSFPKNSVLSYLSTVHDADSACSSYGGHHIRGFQFNNNVGNVQYGAVHVTAIQNFGNCEIYYSITIGKEEKKIISFGNNNVYFGG